MAEMSDLTPAAILAELQNRYQKDAIQTYVGDILIVLNPYIRFKIYLPEVRFVVHLAAHAHAHA